MNVKTTFAALALSMLAAPVLAQDSGPRFGLPGGPGGGLTDAERAQIAEGRFTAADADGDGTLTEEEMVAAVERAMEERRRERISRMIEMRDTDGDGALSLAEVQAPRRGGMFDRLDEDGDGTISRDEFQAMDGMHGRMHHRPRR